MRPTSFFTNAPQGEVVDEGAFTAEAQERMVSLA